MELEVKHLAPYLPYGLKLQYVVREKVEKTGVLQSISHRDFETHPTRVSIEGLYNEEHIWMFTPILHPLSDCENFIEINGERFIPNERIKCLNPNFYYSCGYIYERRNEFTLKYMEYGGYPYWLIELFSQWHIDFQNLIGQGLAVDINTLK